MSPVAVRSLLNTSLVIVTLIALAACEPISSGDAADRAGRRP